MFPSTKTKNQVNKQSTLGTVHNPTLKASSSDLDVDNLLMAGVLEDYYDNDDHQSLTSKQIDGWSCIGSYYSVSYKRMQDRYSPLHNSEFSIDYQMLKEVGGCKVVEVTQCLYELHDNQNIRVSVHAKFIFSELLDS